jgi:putative molybdopterin biosynthesis protein
VAIETVARSYGLGFLPLADEHYDFFIPGSRAASPAVVAFRDALATPDLRATLARLGFMPKDEAVKAVNPGACA